MEDRLGRLIQRAGDLVDLVAAVLFLYIVVVVALEIKDVFEFMKTMKAGW